MRFAVVAFTAALVMLSGCGSIGTTLVTDATNAVEAADPALAKDRADICHDLAAWKQPIDDAVSLSSYAGAIPAVGAPVVGAGEVIKGVEPYIVAWCETEPTTIDTDAIAWAKDQLGKVETAAVVAKTPGS